MEAGPHMLTLQGRTDTTQSTPPAAARFCTQCGATTGACGCGAVGETELESPAPAPVKPRFKKSVALAVAAVIAATAIGVTIERRVAHRIAALETSQAALRTALQRQTEAATAATNGVSDRLGTIEAKLNAQPDPTAIAKSVGASVFTIDAGEDIGSGFAVASDAGGTKFITNYHVVADTWTAGHHTVRIARDDVSYDGAIIAVNPDADLAVIFVSQQLPILKRAAGTPQVGDPVLVIGSPLGLGGTVSSGIVSAMRTEHGHDYIQFSAPISPGNSGGPVVDRSGQVIGVSVAKMVGEGAEGLSFAIPIAKICSSFANVC